MVAEILYHCNGKIMEWKWSTNSELLPAPFWTSCYLIDGLLIDAAAPGSEDEFRTFIKRLSEEEKIEKCVITHSHEDHCGCANMLQSEFNMPIYSSEKAIPLLKKEKNYPDYRKVTWGYPYKPVNAQKIGEKIKTVTGRYCFDIVEIPGHAEDLIALVEREQEWAFILDGVMPKYTMIFGKSTDIPEDIAQIYGSIKKIHDYTEGMDNLLIFTAGRGIFKGREFFAEKMKEIEVLHLQAHEYQKEALARGHSEKKIIKFIVKKVFGGESFIGKFTREDLSNKNLILSLLEWPLK